MTETPKEPQGLAIVGDDIEKASGATAVKTEPEEDEFPSFQKVILIIPAVYLSMFLVAIDRTILGTAIPKITDEFHSIGDVGWYASSYLLTTCAFQLIYGRLYSFFPAKWVLLVAIGIFELGSTVCGTAPNSKAFIIGRAIAGLGSGGIFSGCINLMVILIPLHKRPIYQGIFGAVFGVASVIGPLLGGAFTTNVTWRWCFYLNLPVGGAVVIIILFLLEARPTKNTDTAKQRIMKLDPFGTAAFLPGIVCLLLALQWGGTTYPWGNGRIIALFILAAILLGAFTYIQFRQGENATIPIRILKQRSVASGVYFSFLSPGAMMVIIYFLPLWFQAIKGVDAVRSGIDFLPLVMALVTASISAGILTQKSGYYVPQLIACSIIMSIGAGLISTLKTNTGSSEWIGYQIVFGFGLGLGMQQAAMAVQTCLDKKDVTIGVSLMIFTQSLGGSIFVTVGQTIFTHSLVSHLSKVADLDPSTIVNTGATELRNLVPPQYLDKVLIAYNMALSDTFKVAIVCAAATIISGLTMEWKSIKGLKQGGASGEAQRKEAAKEKGNDSGASTAEVSAEA